MKNLLTLIAIWCIGILSLSAQSAEGGPSRVQAKRQKAASEMRRQQPLRRDTTTVRTDSVTAKADSVSTKIDSIHAKIDSLNAKKDSVMWRNEGEWDLQYEEDSLYLNADFQKRTKKVSDSLQITVPQIDLATIMKPKKFVPNPIRSMWLSMVFPGAGQIYNKKFWKLPIICGGFLGCVYAFSWNSQMLRDYTQAYLDIMDDDPNTKSYEKMLPMGYKIEGKEERFKEIFKNKKNYFRKYRDMSIFAFAGVYLISIIDAYVDAELSTFDISRDLSLHWEPASLNNDTKLQRRYGYKSYGLQCNLSF